MSAGPMTTYGVYKVPTPASVAGPTNTVIFVFTNSNKIHPRTIYSNVPISQITGGSTAEHCLLDRIEYGDTVQMYVINRPPVPPSVAVEAGIR